jgi:ATP-dependent helicase/nuclease subunit A
MVELSMVAHAGAARDGARNAPTPEQCRAADPASSVWVTASAGTGKTRVLADRVLRLLLAASEPQQILCLTFTKAAAAEMVARVQADLGSFATLPDAALRDDLMELLARPATAQELANARSLLARVLDLPSGLPIMTIHGFCQSLLRRFPLEAGVPPHFDVIEPRTAADLLREAQEEVLASREAAIQADLGTLAVLLGESTLAGGLAELREQRLRSGADLGDAEAVVAALYRTLDLPAGATPDAVRAAASADPAIDRAALIAACRALELGSDRDGERCALITAWLTADQSGRIDGYRHYETVFLRVGDRAPKAQSNIITGQAATPAAIDALMAEQERLAAWAEKAKAARVAERTAALLRVGSAVLERYGQRKARLAALDYDDLIERARDLLQMPDAVSWVQYKLDQQIDHLLVDEGQDTSPAQWAIIEALSAEFFVGSGARPEKRTLFVVGDEKQSIMSVQGADVATYQRLRQSLCARAEAGRQPWREEPLNLSFRSAPPILHAVDAVFDAADARDGVTAGAWREHGCFWAERPGLVEVWPLVSVEPPPPAPAWQLPDQHEPADKAEHSLARLIAERIKIWLTDETPLASTGRQMTAGDVMILLPRRGILQELLVRQLKRLRVPVAGADRLALIDEIAVMDLVALGDALLLPEDDLTLAAVLKSPLFELGEEDLFDLAYDRGPASLHDRLRTLAGEREVFAQAHERFAGLLAQADFQPPFELYTRLLGEGGGRERFVARLGAAALEPIEAFLAQTLAYERGHPPSLQGFLHWLRADPTELIRDPDRPRDEVRVLTVHGAKGLEAPVAVLADTTFVPELNDRLLWLEAEGLPLWKVGSARRDQVSAAAHDLSRRRQLEEQRRLLYVAMTRAKEQLIVTGWERKNSAETNWYELITAGLERLPGAERMAMRLGPELEGMGWRLSTQQAAGPRQLGLALAGPAREALAPAWLERAAPPEPGMARPLSPSHLDEASTPAASPLDDVDRYRRGRLVHRLLQSLPERPAGERRAAMARFLAQPALALSEAEQEAIAAEVFGVLEAPAIAHAFGPGSRAEVPLAGVVEGSWGDQAIAGQVDRLVVGEHEVLVIDYKSNRAPPATPDRVPAAYLRQMAAYRALLRQIYPDRRVRCALLWTQGPHLMPLDETALASHAPRAWLGGEGAGPEG